MSLRQLATAGALVATALLSLFCGLSLADDKVEAKIAALEKQLKEKAGKFNWSVHNELRHLYSGRDERKALSHCDIILKNSPMDGYILGILGANQAPDKRKAIASLKNWPTKYPEFKHLAAACWLKAADLTKAGNDTAKAKAWYRKVAASKGADLDHYRTLAETRLADFDRVRTKAPWTVPVLVLKYFPVTRDKRRIDIRVTSNVGAPLADIRAKCNRMTRETARALEQGSRFRAYKNPRAPASLKYVVVKSIEYLELMPHHPKKKGKADYIKILNRADIRHYVEKKGVKEVWIWGYHSKELAPWESNMASVHGDISNSDRDPLDLPILKKTYTVYHYNYERETSEAVHNHIHQIEAIMRHYGGELWQTFEGKPGAWRCGNCHFPPNGRSDYDWANKNFVLSDIEDWKPEGFGKKKRLNCDIWGGDSLRWFIYWMRSIPGAKNGLTFKGKPLTNWWIFMGDYDQAVLDKVGLTQ